MTIPLIRIYHPFSRSHLFFMFEIKPLSLSETELLFWKEEILSSNIFCSFLLLTLLPTLIFFYLPKFGIFVSQYYELWNTLGLMIWDLWNTLRLMICTSGYAEVDMGLVEYSTSRRVFHKHNLFCWYINAVKLHIRTCNDLLLTINF